MPGGTLSNAPQEVAGNQVPSAGWNTMATDLSLLSQPPCCHVSLSTRPFTPANQPMTAAQLAANPATGSLYANVPWQAASDPWTMLDTTGFNVVIPAGWGGVYDLDVSMVWQAGFLPNNSLSGSTFTLAATTRADILLNGGSVVANVVPCANFFVPTMCNVSMNYPLSAGTKVSACIGQTGGPANSPLAFASMSVTWRSQ